MNNTHKEFQDPRKAFAAEVEKIEGMPQMQRWRAIKELLFRVKPEFIPLDQAFCQAIREEREFNMLKETGASKSGDIRKLFSMPQYLYATLHLIDPEFTKMQEDPVLARELNHKLARTFPEYRLAKRI